MKPPPLPYQTNSSGLILPLLLGLSIPLLLVLYITLFIREYHARRASLLPSSSHTPCKCYYCRIVFAISRTQKKGYSRKAIRDRFRAYTIHNVQFIRPNDEQVTNALHLDGASSRPQSTQPTLHDNFDDDVGRLQEGGMVMPSPPAATVSGTGMGTSVGMERMRRWSTAGTDTTVTSLPPYTEMLAVDGAGDESRGNGNEMEMGYIGKKMQEGVARGGAGSLRRMPTTMRMMQSDTGSSSVGRSFGKRLSK